MSGGLKPVLIAGVVVAAILAGACTSSPRIAPSRVKEQPATPNALPRSSTVCLPTCDIGIERVTVIDEPGEQLPIHHYPYATKGPSREAVVPADGERFVDVFLRLVYTDGRSAGRVDEWTERLLVDGELIEPVDFGKGSSGATATIGARFSVAESDSPMVLRVTPPSKLSPGSIDFNLR